MKLRFYQNYLKPKSLATILLLMTLIAFTLTKNTTIKAVYFPQFDSESTGSSMPQASYLPLIFTPPAVNSQPSWSVPIALSPTDNRVWVVNPDADSVTAFDGDTLRVLAQVAVGSHPRWIAIAPDGQTVYVINSASGTLSILNITTYHVENSIEIGPEPGGIVLTPSGETAYISLLAADEIAVVDLTEQAVTARIATKPKPYALALGNEKLYVTHLLAQPRVGGAEATDDGREASVSIIDTTDNSLINEIILAPDTNGFPNLLTGIALSGDHAWLPHVRAAPALPTSLISTVFAAVSMLDLNEVTEDRSAFLPLNDQEIFGSPVNNPVAAIPSPDGQRLYVVLAGSDLLEIVDIAQPQQPKLIKFLATGRNPQGMALSTDGKRGYVMNYLSRSVTVYDLENLVMLDEIQVTDETLPADILQGKILFNNAVDPRLSQGSWISCASCHFDGLPDGVTWMFPDGPRQTPTLWQAGETLPWHWSAALDEPQDVEETIHLIQHGLGLAPGTDPKQLGSLNRGRAQALDDLAVFVTEGIRTFTLPEPTEEVTIGRSLFIMQGCADCHGGAQWTVSALPHAAGASDPDGNGMVDEALYDVGTYNPADIRGETGFDVPSLLNVGLTAPYLHDGSYATLEALLISGHPVPDEGESSLSGDELAALVAFVRSIGAETEPIDVMEESRSTKPKIRVPID